MSAPASSSASAAPAASASSSPPFPSPLHELHALIDQWGLSVWNSQKVAGTNTAAASSVGQQLVPCEDVDWAVQKGVFVARMLHLKQLSLSAIAQYRPPPSRVRFRKFCQCSKNTPCTTLKCKCKAKGRTCTIECKCRGQCGNNQLPPSSSHVPAAPLLQPIPPFLNTSLDPHASLHLATPFSSAMHDNHFDSSD